MSLYLYLHIYKTGGMTIRRMLRQWLSAEEYDEIDTPDWKTGLARIKEAKEDYFAGKKCLFGHLWYGWHSFLPCPARYVTLLREPTERMLSFFWYHRTMPSHPEHKLASQLGFSDYVKQRRLIWTDNGQVRQLAGLLNESGQHQVGFGGVTQEHLESLLSKLAF